MQDKQQLNIHTDYRVYPTKSIIELRKLINHTSSMLNQINIPVQLMHSKADKGVEIKNLNKLYHNIPSKAKSKVVLENSGHVITEDIEKEIAFDAINNFIQQNII